MSVDAAYGYRFWFAGVSICGDSIRARGASVVYWILSISVCTVISAVALVASAVIVVMLVSVEIAACNDGEDFGAGHILS